MSARFLVLRGGALGDFLVTLPVLAALRERWPDAHLELVGYSHVAGLAAAAGLVNRVASLHGARIAQFFSLRPDFPDEQVAWIRSFDFVISYLHDPDGTVRENLRAAGARTVLYGSPMIGGGHAVDQLLKPLEGLALYAAGAIPRLPWPEAGRERARRQYPIFTAARPVVMIHPGSGSPRKNWPLERFVALARHIAAAGREQPVFLTGEADDEAARGLARLAADFPHLHGLELAAVADALAASARYIGNDSGITHLAAALGLPTLALFGPTDPACWAPRGPHVRILRAPGGELEQLEVGEVVSDR